jgi:anti-sigma factor RsiW
VPSIEISCLEVWREISNYLEGDVDPELRRRMEEHFKVCEHCTAVLDGTRNVVQIVANGEAFDVPAGFADRLRKRIEERARLG